MGRGPWLTLVGGIDDATGIVTGGVFREQEDAAGYFEVLIQTAADHGLPLGLYSDRHGIFWRGRTIPTIAEQFAGRQPTTQLGRALEAAGIAWIAARSPQAKGRVERLWGTLQDRLVVELRLAGAATIDDANRVLARYLPRHNERFAVPALDPDPAWRPLAAGRGPEVFCFRHARRLARDGTLTLNGRSLMLSGREGRPTGSRPIILQERLDGSFWIELDGRFEPIVTAPERPTVLRLTPSTIGAAVVGSPAKARSPLAPLPCGSTTVTESLAAYPVKVAGRRQTRGVADAGRGRASPGPRGCGSDESWETTPLGTDRSIAAGTASLARR